MLSDHERKALQEVERQFMAQDPDFTRSFDTARQPSTYSIQCIYEMPWWAYRIAIGLAVALGFLMMLSGAPWTAILFAGLAVLFSVVQKRRSEPGRRER
ncbi:DUF3040 domain-containing protein [Pseudonocardia sp. KRD291]|uniref:DUF3040 domain-containing protein n=1 Tax=Pseudonocardia sp. KRD291 TaxID=2792007 RepID=UPI001C49F090|nr:DUF3040 domain-containing protein [Pseudonocardia sp. KRD291]MBW0101805.1 DUF3040 domain-containing protein [Pseudonocardia sp. KRD291]